MRFRCLGCPVRQAEGSRSFQFADFGPGYGKLARRKGRIAARQSRGRTGRDRKGSGRSGFEGLFICRGEDNAPMCGGKQRLTRRAWGIRCFWPHHGQRVRLG